MELSGRICWSIAISSIVIILTILAWLGTPSDDGDDDDIERADDSDGIWDW